MSCARIAPEISYVLSVEEMFSLSSFSTLERSSASSFSTESSTVLLSVVRYPCLTIEPITALTATVISVCSRSISFRISSASLFSPMTETTASSLFKRIWMLGLTSIVMTVDTSSPPVALAHRLTRPFIRAADNKIEYFFMFIFLRFFYISKAF